MQRYPYKYLDSWERLNNEILPEKKGSYSNLTMKDTIDADYNHAKRVWEDFGIENLYVQRNFIEIYKLDQGLFYKKGQGHIH